MSKDEIKALTQLKERQNKRIKKGEMRVVGDTEVTLPDSPAHPTMPHTRIRIKPKETKKEGTKKMRNPIDMYGNTINEGHYINYPCRKGSDTYMRTAKVLRVRERQNHLDNPMMVLDVAVAIAPRAWERKTKNWEDKVVIRKVTVSCPYRSTIVPVSYIKSDKRYRKLLTV